MHVYAMLKFSSSIIRYNNRFEQSVTSAMRHAWLCQGRIQDYQIEGGGKYLCTHRTFGVQGPLFSKGPESSKDLDAFSRYLSLILKHPHGKLNIKNMVDQKLEGGGANCAPAWIRHLLCH